MIEDFIGGFNISVADDPKVRIPKSGDKVILTDEFYDTLSDGKECAKLARLPYCIVDDFQKIPEGSDGNYRWVYPIYVKETGYMVGTSYKFYDE
jgi:hypothetical protein